MRGGVWALVLIPAALLAPRAGAADRPPPMPDPAAVTAPPVAAASWTGFYLGGSVGAGLVATRWGPGTGELAGNPANGFVNTGSATSAIIAGQAGYNYQVGPYVLGIEGALGSGFLFSRARCLIDGVSICTADTDAIATLTGRLGYAFGPALVYGKAGGALAHTSASVNGLAYSGQYTDAQWKTGWTVGGGVEMALTPQLSARAEYAYLDFGTPDTGLRNGMAASVVPVAQSAQLVTLGLNWRPWGPPLPGTQPAQPVPVRDWTGIYVGVHAGGVWGRDQWTSGTGTLAAAAANGNFPGAADPLGLLGGGQVGVTYQMGPWVAGAEVSVGAASIADTAKCVTGLSRDPSVLACQSTVDSLGSVSARLGQSWGDLLVYGKAGAAWANGSSEIFSPLNPAHASSSGTRWGWMLGGGVEHALTARLSSFLEYDYYDFGTRHLSYSGAEPSGTASFQQQLAAVRMGLNYRFGGDGRETPAALQAPRLPAGWTAEIGARAFASTGRMQGDLMDPLATGHLNSRLIYANTTGQSLETFFRFENQGGLFLKGYAGLGTLAGGSLNDEDFPGVYTYSNTLTAMHDGRLAYGALDLGHEVIRQGDSTLGAFVGYRALYQTVNGFGCRQLATDGICDTAQGADYPALRTGLGLSETQTWQGVALGLNARLALSDRLRLDVDAAYLPYATFAGADNHWWRPDINPLMQSGRGWGTQAEAVLNYAVTERLDVGVGARYWYFATDTASTQFTGLPLRSPMTFYIERYGAFLQASYRFGDLPPPTAGAEPAARAGAAVANWTGFYAGGALGGGKGHSTYASPFPRPVSGDAVDLGGALAGGQIGGDYQMGAVVIGAEASAAWANAVGSDTCFSTLDLGENSGFGCASRVTALGTVTGRLGYAFARSLLYIRGGFAWDRRSDSFNTFIFNGQTLGTAGTGTGWTLGGGLDYMLLPNLSVGLEYKHFDLGGGPGLTTTSPLALAGVSLSPNALTLDMVAMTVNYRFATGP